MSGAQPYGSDLRLLVVWLLVRPPEAQAVPQEMLDSGDMDRRLRRGDLGCVTLERVDDREMLAQRPCVRIRMGQAAPDPCAPHLTGIGQLREERSLRVAWWERILPDL